MYIHEIILEGFKSYAQRTVVSGFDPQFNAITGLNGTGKSNILDSICFVLGISNLSQVRVGNLQELVYKQGQAGVTKASVTIVFNNTDSSCSPVGYDTHKQITVTRQVVIGGTNKYMINGRTAQQSQVQNLFHSVQLNVNNPHFLIMQGRITKVLNMKPLEILSMIEEAAGTRMFESKKQIAIKTMEKKQLKVDEMTKCMDEEITPQLNSLRSEKQQYQTWLTTTAELQKLKNYAIAFEFYTNEKNIELLANEKKCLEDAVNATQLVINERTEEYNQCKLTIENLIEAKDNDYDKPLKELERQEKDARVELSRVQQSHANLSDTVSSDRDGVEAIKKQIKEIEKEIEKKKEDLRKKEIECSTRERDASLAEEQSVAERTRYQNAVAGVTDDSNRELLSLPEQIGELEKKQREATSQLQQGVQRCAYAKEALKELSRQKSRQQQSFDAATRQIDALGSQISQLQLSLSTSKYNESEESQLRLQCQQLQKECTRCRDDHSNLMVQVETRLKFQYRDPERGFDRTRVKGLVAKLVTVSDVSTATALEVVAGGKLFNVVVDTEITSKQLLQKGDLKKRVTILPLNKLSTRCVDSNKANQAKQIAGASGATAAVALELVMYDQEVAKAMEYVFGGALVVSDARAAREIAFHKGVRTKTVTLEGDAFDPSGTLTGGAATSLGQLLRQVYELGQLQQSLVDKEKMLINVQQQLLRLEEQGAAVRQQAASLEAAEEGLRLQQDRLNESSYGMVMKEIAEHEATVAEVEQGSAALKLVAKQAAAELSRLNDTEKDIKKRREKAMKACEAQAKAAKQHASEQRAIALRCQTEKEEQQSELLQLEAESLALTDQLQRSSSDVALQGDRLAASLQQVDSASKRQAAIKTQLDEKKADAAKCTQEIKLLETKRDKCMSVIRSASEEMKQQGESQRRLDIEAKNSIKMVEMLQKHNSWLCTERTHFGVVGGPFDFSGVDGKKLAARVGQLQGDEDRLSKGINKKVMGAIERAEEQYAELSRKREVILKDKMKIVAVIEELEEKKTQALQSTWMKVNKDFGSIFAMLLPGVQSKLEPVEGTTVLDGLEVRVAFNNIWKESLTELSGGQRSLLALSLILAMLLFKPAPMYILDEVDAALDLSHTQNIGLMLRTHFSSSQFIVVSLKEGMFNNANVIFRTKFVDGVSAVTRTVVGGKNRSQLIDTTINENEKVNKEKAKRKVKSKKLIEDTDEEDNF